MIEELVDEPEQEASEVAVLEGLDSGLFSTPTDPNSNELSLIDDPVTGVGNEDLWEEPECEDGSGEESSCGPP